MKKFGAASILTAMFLGLMAWGSNQIIENKTNIAKLQESDQTEKEMLREMRSDIKILLRKSR